MDVQANEAELRAEITALQRRCAAYAAEVAVLQTQVDKQEKFHQLFHANPDSILITELEDGRIVDANEAAERLTRYNRDELIGRTIFELSLRASQQERAAWLQRLLSEGIVHDVEYVLSTRDNAEIFLKATSQIIDLNGRPRIMTIARDDTPAHNLARSLHVSEERYRLLAENITDVIWMMNLRTGYFTYISPSVEKLYGYTVEEVMQIPFTALLTGESLAVVAATIAEVEESDPGAPPLVHRRMELEQVRKDGSSFWSEVMVSALYDENAALSGALGITRDMTERRAQEVALRELNATLDQRVRERTQQLEAANSALERSARAKDEFLATMSHELRTPLVGVLNMAEALQTGVYGMPSEEMRRSLHTIEHSGRLLLKLVNEILDYSRIELGRLELAEDFFAVHDVVRGALQAVEERAAAQQIQIELALPPASAGMVADYRRVQQMLTNLLDNAVKFTLPGGKAGLEVTADAAQQTVQFAVWDTGIGIPAAEQERIFEPFVQLDSQFDRRYGGAGLGLALVQRLAALHGGSVSVTSQPGAGSRFLLTLPWCHSAAPENTAAT